MVNPILSRCARTRIPAVILHLYAQGRLFHALLRGFVEQVACRLDARMQGRENRQVLRIARAAAVDSARRRLRQLRKR